jgi:hypothetical protein
MADATLTEERPRHTGGTSIKTIDPKAFGVDPDPDKKT